MEKIYIPPSVLGISNFMFRGDFLKPQIQMARENIELVDPTTLNAIRR
jgi:hypothetical protein